jgi:anti-sigma factor RsiW
MTCAELAARLTEFIEGVLPEDTEAEAIEHLATCPACERVLGGTRDVMGLGRRHGRIVLDDDRRSALLGRIAEATSSVE